MSRRCRIFLVVTFAVVLVTPMQTGAWGQTGGWWKSAWKSRRSLRATIPPGVEADEPLAVAKFLTHGRVKPDGSDVRVVARGKEVPSRVLRLGPGDEVTVAFPLSVGIDAYQVYYGNPRAQPPDYDWEIRAGLLLEVRKYRRGFAANLHQALATWGHSTEVIGAGFVPKIYFGHNPFGPSHAFVARYTGWLRVEKPGRYEFLTSSSHGSFLLIDGKEVVSWPGRHRPTRRPRRRGTVELKVGRYKLEYYHIHMGGDPTAVAAWKRPGDRRPGVIPEWAFLPVARAVVQPAQLYGKPVTPDFDYTRHEAFLQPDRDTFVYRYLFRDITDGVDRKYYRPLWDFGDGNTSNVWMPNHVYLTGGTYTVTYQLKGVRGTGTTTQRIVVERDWARQASANNLESLEKYYPIIRGYDFARMAPGSLRAACEMFERLGRYDDLVRVARVLLFGTTDADDADIFGETERLAQVYLTRRRDAKSAVEVYLNGAGRVTLVDRKAELFTRAAAVVLEHLGETARAGEYYKRVLQTRQGLRDETRRRALIGMAEVAIFAGNGKEAERLLREADAISIRRSEQGGEAVRVGSLSRAIEDYTRRTEFEAARELLDAWEWEYPLDRLVGYSTLLRAKLHISREEYDRAVRLLTSLVEVNPKSNYAAEALMTAAGCRLKLGDKTGARDTYKRVLTGYPESPLVRDALKQLEALR